ncbi:Flp family type IVb pilin [Falsiroseomonas oryziterrae]|uniref:Flp family type IVb pilin n=1 Tax=Falsiroseomonas oryziterrae TaxID=2911368 RepID=UPI001F185F12|nr:Flp family type IVb pilin [Roseomonas sp. NPKOSM-4]
MFEKLNLAAVRAYAALSSVGKDKKGVTAVEYGVIAALIIVVCIAAISLVGTRLNSAFSVIGSSLPAAR